MNSLLIPVMPVSQWIHFSFRFYQVLSVWANAKLSIDISINRRKRGEERERESSTSQREETNQPLQKCRCWQWLAPWRAWPRCGCSEKGPPPITPCSGSTTASLASFSSVPVCWSPRSIWSAILSSASRTTLYRGQRSSTPTVGSSTRLPCRCMTKVASTGLLEVIRESDPILEVNYYC